MADFDKTTIQLLALTRYAHLPARTIEGLLRRFGDPDHILEADHATLSAVEGLSENEVDEIIGCAGQEEAALYYLKGLDDRDIAVRARLQTTYPPGLMELHDPPTLLYYRGRLPDPSVKTVTICGTQEATQEGLELTSRLAKMFASAEVQIVSTLGVGIDAAVHLGARAVEGMSFAVTDVGFDSPILAGKMPLAIDIVRDGGIVSESAPDEEPDGGSFREANRIIAGLSQAVVVTEFYEKSERTLDLLDCCNEIGKLAFVMIDDRWGALSDKVGLKRALDNGAIPMTGWDKVDGIIKSLV